MMILPSGAFCLIHKVHTDHRGWLVLHSNVWDSQADHDTAKPPAMQSDHDFGPGHEKIVDLLTHLARAIDSEFSAGHRGERTLGTYPFAAATADAVTRSTRDVSKEQFQACA